MSLYPFSTESMEWDTFAVTDEPVTTADFFVESISSEESEESTYSSDVDTDEIPNLNEDSDDAAENDIIDNPFEDLDFQNFQAAEIRDINDRLDAEIQTPLMNLVTLRTRKSRKCTPWFLEMTLKKNLTVNC